MVHKFMVNSAFKAPLLLRPSYQRTVSFATVNKLGCPIRGRPMPPLILSFRSYSESTQNLPPPKTSGSTEGSDSSKPGDKKGWTWFQIVNITGAFTITGGVFIYITQSMWENWYQAHVRRGLESDRDGAIYNKLKKGPVFKKKVLFTVPREPLVEEIRKLITPSEESRLYPLILGEHGTGKTSLIKLAVDGINENKPKGIVYVSIPLECDLEIQVAKAMQAALGWEPNELIDSGKSASLEGSLEIFSRFAAKYNREYKRVPVLIIDNINKLAPKQQRLLNMFQDYAKLATDEGIATVVFVSSEGHVPRRMMERSSWSRRGKIIEIGDVSEEEALQYLKLRKVDEKQAAQIYKLVGGRMIYLKSIVDDMEITSSLEAILETMTRDTKRVLKSAEIVPGRRYHEKGGVIIRELLKKGSISDDTYYRLVDANTGDELLEKNVFAMHVNSGEVTFQSTLVKRVCEENSALWSKV